MSRFMIGNEQAKLNYRKEQKSKQMKKVSGMKQKTILTHIKQKAKNLFVDKKGS